MWFEMLLLSRYLSTDNHKYETFIVRYSQKLYLQFLFWKVIKFGPFLKKVQLHGNISAWWRVFQNWRKICGYHDEWFDWHCALSRNRELYWAFTTSESRRSSLSSLQLSTNKYLKYTKWQVANLGPLDIFTSSMLEWVVSDVSERT